MLLSLVVPCFNEEKSIILFFDEIYNVLNELDMDWEIIFVNDGSRDNTLAIIKDLSNKFKSIKYISFSRNFGKEAALYAGLNKSKGDYVVVIDVDLQDPPSLLPEMLNIIKTEDYDIVATRRVSRKGEPFIRSIFARLFYKFINSFSEIH